MARTTPTGADSGGAARSPRQPPKPHDEHHPFLHVGRPFGPPIPTSSVSAVRAVARLDGRTRIIAGREPGGRWWKLRHRLHFTREQARKLKEAGVSEVVLKRGIKRAAFPLGWLSNPRD